jgi:hypothetical protein
MFEGLEALTTQQLRLLLLHESKKFVFALELGSPVLDLETIRNRIRHATELLENREKAQLNPNDTTVIISPPFIEGLGQEPAQA